MTGAMIWIQEHIVGGEGRGNGGLAGTKTGYAWRIGKLLVRGSEQEECFVQDRLSLRAKRRRMKCCSFVLKPGGSECGVVVSYCVVGVRDRGRQNIGFDRR